MPRYSLSQLLLPTVLSAAFLLTACDNEPEYSGSHQTEDGGEMTYEVEGESGQMTFESDSGEGKTQVTWGEASAVSEAFPADIPVYPELKVMASAENQELGHFSLQGSSEDQPEKVMSYYQQKLKDAGWEQTDAAKVGQMDTQSFKKADRVLSLTVMPGQAGMGQSILSLVTQAGES